MPFVVFFFFFFAAPPAAVLFVSGRCGCVSTAEFQRKPPPPRLLLRCIAKRRELEVFGEISTTDRGADFTVF